MERRVKERLVGASILVVLIVLIVPELLSGPAPPPVGVRAPVSAPEPLRNVTVDLTAPASSAQLPETQSGTSASAVPGGTASGGSAAVGTAGGDAAGGDKASGGAADSAGSGTGANASPRVAAPPSASPAHAGSSEPLEPAAPAPTKTRTAVVSKAGPGGHGWSVQLGSFASRTNADKLARQVKAQGFSVYVSSGGSGASVRYRVRTGPMADRGTATQEAAKLKALGHPSSLVSPAS
jgi:DedD protein